jgi:hypothetical protein
MRVDRGAPTVGSLGGQPLDATLTALAAANWEANAVPVGSGADTFAQIACAANTFLARASTGNLVAKPITDFGLSLVDDSNAAAGRVTLGVSQINRLIASIIGANMNVDTDQAMTMALTPAKYIIRKIVATNASINLTTAAGGIYTAASKSGVTVVANTQVYTALTAAAKFVDLTLAAGVTADVATAATLFLSLTTPQGAAATADIYVFGDVLTP